MLRWKNRILNPLVMFLAGLASGFIVKEIDIHFYAQHFGISLSEIFSQAGVWVLIGVAISLFSRNRKYAMANIFTYCAGMLITYYLTAMWTHSVYGWTFIKGWAVFACLSPVMAYIVTLTKGRGFLPMVIKIGIFAGYIGLNILLGGFIKIYDILFLILLVYLLFIKNFTQTGERDD